MGFTCSIFLGRGGIDIIWYNTSLLIRLEIACRVWNLTDGLGLAPKKWLCQSLPILFWAGVDGTFLRSNKLGINLKRDFICCITRPRQVWEKPRAINLQSQGPIFRGPRQRGWDTDILPPSVEVRLDTWVCHGFFNRFVPALFGCAPRIPDGNQQRPLMPQLLRAGLSIRKGSLSSSSILNVHHVTRLETKCQSEWNSSNINGSSCKNIT